MRSGVRSSYAPLFSLFQIPGSNSYPFEAFVEAHASDDPMRLLLSCKAWPELPVDIPGVRASDVVANTIASRRKLREKCPEWASVPGLVYPDTLCAEQCSSSATARYKASVALRSVPVGRRCRIADLTGGLGVDDRAFAEGGFEVLYNERNVALCSAAAYNFKLLGHPEIIVRSMDVRPDPECLDDLLGDFLPDVIYLDPARRAGDGRKVFLLEDCSPDVLPLLPLLLRRAPLVMLKISPMADISRMESQIGQAGGFVREVHVVASKGECKELLVLVSSGSSSAPCRITVWEDGTSWTYDSAEETTAPAPVSASPQDIVPGSVLFVPGKALMKAAPFRLLAGDGLRPLDSSTHVYLIPSGTYPAPEILALGKTMKVEAVLSFRKDDLHRVRAKWPHGDITSRNLPMTSDALRKRLGITPGPGPHIFGLRVSGTPLLIVTFPFTAQDATGRMRGEREQC